MAGKRVRIGVTGASGFVGTHLVDALRQSASAREIRTHRLRAGDSADNLARFVSGLDVIYHLAGVNRGTDEDIVRGNILATLRLAESLRAHGKPGARVVFASSAQVYKPSGRGAISETGRIDPESLYGIAKKTAEDIIRIAGLTPVILRFANVYGPGCRPYYNSVIATFCERAARGQPLTIHGGGAQGRDFVFIDDAIRALLLAGTLPPGKDDTFNVASGKITPLRSIIRWLAEAVPGLRVERLPQTSAGGTSYCCDPSRFRRWSRWTAKTTLDAGLRATLARFRESKGSAPSC